MKKPILNKVMLIVCDFSLAYKHLKELSPNASPRQLLTGNAQFLATVFLLTGSILILLTEILKEN